VKKFFKIVFGIIGGLIALGVIVGACSDTSVEETGGTDSPKQSAESKEPAKTYGIGDVVKVGDVQLTINKGEVRPPAEYSDAKNGSVLALDVTAQNNGTTQEYISTTDYNLYDKDGNQMESYYGYDDTTLDGDLNKGKKLTGKVFFDIRKGETYELIYTPAFSWDSVEVKYSIPTK
jgi:Domain of unknown function (DUF4352)